MDTQYPSSGSLALKRVRIVGLLFAILAGLATALLASATPALADDTEGGGGSAYSGNGGGGCIKSGWTLANGTSGIVWEDGSGGTACGNTAYGRLDRNESDFTNQNGDRIRCNSTNAARNINCSGYYQPKDAPLYNALIIDNSASACGRRSDMHGIWYLTDAAPPGIKSLVNQGDNNAGFRTKTALRDAITTYPASGQGSNAWWDTEARKWWGSGFYDEAIANAQLAFGPSGRNVAIQRMRQGARDYVVGRVNAEVPDTGAPVIYCWFNDATNQPSVTCGAAYDQNLWDAYLQPGGVTRSSPYNANCFRKCPNTVGQYPSPLPRAGQWIPNANSSINPRPASNSEDDIANYCYPPINTAWHQGGYGSEIPGLGWILEDTTGGSNVGSASDAWPYAYITALEDGNAAYNPTTKKGNAPNQGQFPGRSTVKKSSFGTFYDNYCASGGGGNFRCDADYIGDPGNAQYNQFKAAYNAAITAVPNDTHAVTDLTAAEKDAVAKGRILNVAEYVTYATAEGRKYRNKFYTRLASRIIYYNISGNERSNSTTFDNWTPDASARPGWNGESVPADQAGVYRPNFSDGTTFDNAHPDQLSISSDLAVYGSTPKPSALWQNAVNHCNNQEFRPLNPAGNANNPNETGVIDTGDTSQYYSASAVDKLADSQWRVDQNINLADARWGQSANGGNSPSNKAAFFDRLCYYPGAAKNPTNMAAMTAAAPASYTFFRDNEQYKVEGKNNGDSPFFVPSFTGEDRTTTVTSVVGYKADKSTRATADSWAVTYEETVQTGSTYNAGSPPYYAGYYNEYYTCNIGRRQSYCIAPGTGTQCRHENSLAYGVRWANNTGQPANQPNGCQGRVYYTDTYVPGQAPYYTYTYGWQARSANYSTDASATSVYNSCLSRQGAGDPGRTRNCNKTMTAATWTAPTSVSVPSCPQVDTATERYTNCVPVTKTTSTTTNYNVVDYQNEDPTQVIVTRDQLGTPKVDLMKMQGLANDGSKTELFSTDPNDVRTPRSDGIYQSQFNSTAQFKSSTVAVNTGAWRRLQTQAAYASDKALPQVVTLAWYFTPSVKSTFAQTNVGYGRAGGLMTYNKGGSASPVRGRVEAVSTGLTTDDGQPLAAHQDEVWANTGTDIQDGLNVPLYYGTKRAAAAPFAWTSDPTKYSPHYYALKFVRAVGE